MRLKDRRHLTYCLNVHPGETLEEVETALDRHVPAVHDALCPDAPFGLGLRLARSASDALCDPTRLSAFREKLATGHRYAFTINGFPYGAFHGTRVKEKVYLPDWTSPERETYTLNLCRQLSALLPEGVNGSVSTVPLGYRTPGTPCRIQNGDHDGFLARCAGRLQTLARNLADLEAATGRWIHIGLEPEPDCVLETTQQTVAFFNQHLFDRFPKEESILRRHIGVCFDTCHAAMQFETPSDSLRHLRKAGIRVSKVQLSAALDCDAAGVEPSRLNAFDDGVYLHQTRTDQGGRWPDLPAWLSDRSGREGRLRIHAHVPLDWKGDELLGSTRHTLDSEFWAELNRSGCEHLEVETYTFGVLPGTVSGGRSVEEDMISECRWAIQHL